MLKRKSIKNKQNLNLSVLINHPEDLSKEYPAVIIVHGFLGYKEEEHLESLAELLAENDIVAVRFDASGWGESQGGVEKDFRFSNYLEDIDTIFNFTCELSYVDSNNVGLFGHSLGAMLAIIFAEENKAVKAVCSNAPSVQFAKTDTLSRYIDRWERTGFFNRTSSKYGKTSVPFEFALDAGNYDISEYAKNIAVPTLVIVGGKDKATFPESARKIFESIPDKKEYLEIPEMTHHYKKEPENMKLVNDKVLEFFKTYLTFQQKPIANG